MDDISPGFLPEDLFTDEEVKHLVPLVKDVKEEATIVPLETQLPQLMYFSHQHSKIPLQRIYGILMSVGTPGKSAKQPRYKGSVFVLPPEELQLELVTKLSKLTPDLLFHWAIDHVPVAWRFPSISYAITHLTLNEQSLYRKPFTKPKRYKLARKKWRIFSTNVTLASILASAREHPLFDGERIPHFQLFKSRRAVGGTTPASQGDGQVARSTRKRTACQVQTKRKLEGDQRDDQGMLQQQETVQSKQAQVHVISQKSADRERGAAESLLYTTLRSCVQQILQESLLDQIVRTTIHKLRQMEAMDASPICNTQGCPASTQAVFGAIPVSGLLGQRRHSRSKPEEGRGKGEQRQAFDTPRSQDRQQDRVSPNHTATSDGEGYRFQGVDHGGSVLRSSVGLWPSALDPPPLVRPMGLGAWKGRHELHPISGDAEEAWSYGGTSRDPPVVHGKGLSQGTQTLPEKMSCFTSART